MKIYTKEELINELRKIRDLGFVKNNRHGNHGGIGNTLEDLLGIEENNLPVPNAAEWELKTQRINTASLTTLFHSEPSPTALRFIPQVLLPKYGWRHQEAGIKYTDGEMSFRQTISLAHSDRGFRVVVNDDERKVLISFSSSLVHPRHAEWLETVKRNVGLSELNPQPYWGYDDLASKAGTKLHNCFYVQAEVKKINGEEYYHYKRILKLSKFRIENFLEGLRKGYVLVDFDARTGHNHGTKFRLRQNCFQYLYNEIEEL